MSNEDINNQTNQNQDNQNQSNSKESCSIPESLLQASEAVALSYDGITAPTVSARAKTSWHRPLFSWRSSIRCLCMRMRP